MNDTIFTKISVPTPISEQTVKGLLCNAIEGGSNYWVSSLDRMGAISKAQAEYHHDVPFVEGGWLEMIDEDGKKHRIDRAALLKGLEIMAREMPHNFADVLNENDDAGTGDVFLQCATFGEVIYG